MEDEEEEEEDYIEDDESELEEVDTGMSLTSPFTTRAMYGGDDYYQQEAQEDEYVRLESITMHWMAFDSVALQLEPGGVIRFDLGMCCPNEFSRELIVFPGHLPIAEESESDSESPSRPVPVHPGNNVEEEHNFEFAFGLGQRRYPGYLRTAEGLLDPNLDLGAALDLDLDLMLGYCLPSRNLP